MYLNYTNNFLIITLQLEKGIKQDIYVLSLISLEHKNFFFIFIFSVSCLLSLHLSSPFSPSTPFSTSSLIGQAPSLQILIGSESIGVQSLSYGDKAVVSLFQTLAETRRGAHTLVHLGIRMCTHVDSHIWANFSHPFTQTLRWYDIESKYLKWNHVSTLAPKVIM